MSTILVVDDEPAIVDVLEDHLQSEGYDTCHAYSGEEALASLANFVPDLVILDVMLPGMNGYEVCRIMQADVRFNHIPVIMLTAQSGTPDRVMGYQRGADDYITKPFEPDELSVRVRAQLHHLYHDSVSELTGLPGVEAVEKKIAEVLANHADEWEIIYVDIANFSAYNESYSYVEGDDMIELAALALKTAVQKKGSKDGSDFVGHTGGDKFAIVVHANRAQEVMDAAQRTFTEAITDFYTPADSRQGHIVTINRQGAPTKSGLCALRFDVVGDAK
jgi:diguanylate cyclase (GGDEF)-like protein